MAEGNGNEAMQAEVNIGLDHEGRVRVNVAGLRNGVEALALIQIAFDTVQKQMIEQSRIIAPPKGLFAVPGGRG